MILTEQPGAASWPITAATFILMHKVPADAEASTLALKFFDWAYKSGDQMAEELDYIPMPDNVVELVRRRLSPSLQSVAATDASSKNGAPMLIGKLAAETGVNIETIRYYERVGLLAAPPRTEGRHRVYSEQDAQRLTFIRRSRQLGFSLEDIRTLLDLSDGKRDCAAKELTLRHLDDVRGKIASLTRLERALKSMTEACKPGAQTRAPSSTLYQGETKRHNQYGPTVFHSPN